MMMMHARLKLGRQPANLNWRQNQSLYFGKVSKYLELSEEASFSLSYVFRRSVATALRPWGWACGTSTVARIPPHVFSCSPLVEPCDLSCGQPLGPGR
jgi:hypothetical protein